MQISSFTGIIIAWAAVLLWLASAFPQAAPDSVTSPDLTASIAAVR